MPGFLPLVEGGQKRSSKTRAPRSLTQEGRQAQALWCWLQCSPGRMLQPPLLLPPPSPAVSTDGTHTGPQPWLSHAGAALGSGRRKRICSMFLVLPLSPPCPVFFFSSCGSREQPVSRITEAVTDTAGPCEALCTAPDSSPPPSCTLGQPPKCLGLVLSSNPGQVCRMLSEVWGAAAGCSTSSSGQGRL